eukprot:PhF_6_TR43103/c0_g1_i4/m.65862/K04427/MAP3K7, TAK1; mitogen-activated protein kinase kinase kinase 7
MSKVAESTLIRIPRSAFPASFPDNEVLGSGATCTVYKISWKDTDYAFKAYHPHVTKALEREVKTLTFLQHPRILTVHAMVVSDSPIDPKPVGLLLQLVSGTIQDQKPRPDTPVLLRWLGQVAVALQFAHSLGVVHADVKPDNILITPDGEAVLSDFGSAHRVSATVNTQSGTRGTALYRAPEHDEKTLTPQCDVFSFGMTMWTVLHPPQTDHKMGRGDTSIMKSISTGKRPPLDESILTPDLCTLIQSCWAEDPQLRPTMDGVCDALHGMLASSPSQDLPFQHPHGDILRTLHMEGLIESYNHLQWSDNSDGTMLMALAPKEHPMHKFVVDNLRQRNTLEFTIPSEIEVKVVQHKILSETWCTHHKFAAMSRANNPSLSFPNPTDPESVAGLDAFKKFLIPEPEKVLSRALLVWHGTRQEYIESTCRDGPRSYRTTDAGYFGAGSYVAMEANYAARYSILGDKKIPGIHSVILYACSVSMVTVVTPMLHYPTDTGFSKFYSGDPTKAITLLPKCDAHFIPTKQYGRRHPRTGRILDYSVDYQAAHANVAECHELVLLNHQQLVPLAIVSFKLEAKSASIPHSPHTVIRPDSSASWTCVCTFCNEITANKCISCYRPKVSLLEQRRNLLDLWYNPTKQRRNVMVPQIWDRIQKHHRRLTACMEKKNFIMAMISTGVLGFGEGVYAEYFLTDDFNVEAYFCTVKDDWRFHRLDPTSTAQGFNLNTKVDEVEIILNCFPVREELPGDKIIRVRRNQDGYAYTYFNGEPDKDPVNVLFVESGIATCSGWFVYGADPNPTRFDFPTPTWFPPKILPGCE